MNFGSFFEQGIQKSKESLEKNCQGQLDSPRNTISLEYDPTENQTWTTEAIQKEVERVTKIIQAFSLKYRHILSSSDTGSILNLCFVPFDVQVLNQQKEVRSITFFKVNPEICDTLFSVTPGHAYSLLNPTHCPPLTLFIQYLLNQEAELVKKCPYHVVGSAIINMFCQKYVSPLWIPWLDDQVGFLKKFSKENDAQIQKALKEDQMEFIQQNPVFSIVRNMLPHFKTNNETFLKTFSPEELEAFVALHGPESISSDSNNQMFKNRMSRAGHLISTMIQCIFIPPDAFLYLRDRIVIPDLLDLFLLMFKESILLYTGKVQYTLFGLALLENNFLLVNSLLELSRPEHFLYGWDEKNPHICPLLLTMILFTNQTVESLKNQDASSEIWAFLFSVLEEMFVSIFPFSLFVFFVQKWESDPTIPVSVVLAEFLETESSFLSDPEKRRINDVFHFFETEMFSSQNGFPETLFSQFISFMSQDILLSHGGLDTESNPLQEMYDETEYRDVESDLSDESMCFSFSDEDEEEKE